MLRIQDISLPLSYTEQTLRRQIAALLRCKPEMLRGVRLIRRAVDARKQVHFIAAADVTVQDEDAVLRRLPKSAKVQRTVPLVMPEYRRRRLAHPPVVIGAGPASALTEAGFKRPDPHRDTTTPQRPGRQTGTGRGPPRGAAAHP